MTLKDIESLDKTMLTCADVAPLLGFDPNSLRMQARDDPDLLGFPIIVAGSRALIPKDAFCRFMRYGRTVIINSNDELKYRKEA